ncbi:hypothetical protein [Natrinema sp. SYSU A 869]|uniref:hypothetical protein n=1 Tax=Natrinema sp. SYSU A 869 TaxID=2871694 RepID=UPI0021062D5C|nr:hypothetical protein [Natrinema sp. SYSU A 869]
MSHWRTVGDSIDETDGGLAIELDVGWAAVAGHDPVALLERLGGCFTSSTSKT